MEAPLHQSPVPLPPPDATALLQHAVAGRALTMAAAAEIPPYPPPPAVMMGREQCPRCASRDTKFCYYNNYNTAQPRHFCRACRRYWTLGGSLRNVPVGGSTRKRPRPARPTRALALAAVAAAAGVAAPPPTATSGGPLFPSSPAPAAAGLQCAGAGGLLGPQASAPGGLLGFCLGQPAALGDAAAMQQLGLGFCGGAGPLLWPAATILEGNRAEEEATWKSGGALQFPLPPAAALWQELAAAAPVEVEAAGGLHGLHPHHLLL